MSRPKTASPLYLLIREHRHGREVFDHDKKTAEITVAPCITAVV